MAEIFADFCGRRRGQFLVATTVAELNADLRMNDLDLTSKFSPKREEI